MKTNKIILFAINFILFFNSNIWAHRPYKNDAYGSKTTPIQIYEPEISKVYYSQLNGDPEYYLIISKQPFRLYLNILVAYRPDAQKNFRADLYRDNQIITTLNAGEWVYFDEPWGGDQYWMGPNFNEIMPAGEYTLIMSNPKNLGKYALAIGTVDAFPPSEIVRTLLTLPKIKSDFFDKPAWSAYFNYSGLFAFVFILIVSIFFVFVLKLLRKHT